MLFSELPAAQAQNIKQRGSQAVRGDELAGTDQPLAKPVG